MLVLLDPTPKKIYFASESSMFCFFFRRGNIVLCNEVSGGRLQVGITEQEQAWTILGMRSL